MISDNVQPRVAMPTQRHKSSAYVGDYLRNLASQIVTDRIAAIFAALHDRYGPYCSYFGIMVVLARVSDCMALIPLKSRIIGVHLGE